MIPEDRILKHLYRLNAGPGAPEWQMDALREILEEEGRRLVQDRLSEINAEAEAYDRDASRTLVQICEALPEFDWNDYPEGLTTQDAYDRIMEHIQALEEAKNRRLAQQDSPSPAPEGVKELGEVAGRNVRKEMER